MNTHNEEDFINNCKYIGLRKLHNHYRQLIEQAGKDNKGYYEFIEGIISLEAGAKKERSIAYRIEESKLPRPYKLLKDFNYLFQPKLNKRLILDLSTMEFLKRKESILFIGNCGTGKSHIARSLGLIACQHRVRVYYTTCANMVNDLNKGVYEKTLEKRIYKYIAAELLIIDEMGHDRLELEVTKEAHLLFKVIDERYNQNRPLIFTTNVEEQDWAEYLGDPISTQAILDRIFHRSIRIEITGPSYRKHEGRILQEKYKR